MTRIDEIRKRLEAATPGPWYKDRDFPEVKQSHTKFIVISDGKDENCQNDCQFIAHSRTDIEFLLSLVEEAGEIIFNDLECRCADKNRKCYRCDFLAKLNDRWVSYVPGD